MKNIQIEIASTLIGGNMIDSACTAFGAAATVYQIGVWANIWNPAGQTALIAGGIIAGGCALYAIR
jgi:hypothetical protein